MNDYTAFNHPICYHSNFLVLRLEFLIRI